MTKKQLRQIEKDHEEALSMNKIFDEERKYPFVFERICSSCNGSRQDYYGKCFSCHGTGYILTEIGEKIVDVIKRHFHVVRK